MRHRDKEICSRMGKASQLVQEDNRLSSAFNYRPINSYLVFELRTHNPRTGTKHHIEIKHEIDTGNDRYNVYLNGEKWRKSWSKTGFCRWLWNRIDSVLVP